MSRKSITSRYSTKKINFNYFCGVDVANSGDTSSFTMCKVLTDEEFKNGEQGYIWAPYIPIQGTSIIYGVESVEEKAERIREERKKKMDRINKLNI